MDMDLVTNHRFGQLVVSLYDGRLMAVAVNSGPKPKDIVILRAGEWVDSEGRTRSKHEKRRKRKRKHTKR